MIVGLTQRVAPSSSENASRPIIFFGLGFVSLDLPTCHRSICYNIYLEVLIDFDFFEGRAIMAILDDGILPLLSPLLTWLHFQWIDKVDKNVPQPYLDEVFHIPQANAYWRGNWSHWDDKITTPPGLYFYSIFLNALFDFDYAASVGGDLSPYQLRWSNFLLVYLLILVCIVWKSYAFTDDSPRASSIMHIGTFPLLFFFSGLYYTDVFATFTVMCTYLAWEVGKNETGPLKFCFQSLHIVAGLISLVSRQTNIFWSAVFLGGLQLFETVKKHGKVHDPVIQEVSLEDVPTAITSLVTGAVKIIPQLLIDLWPHLTLLASFGGFVVWNGGVVLGDKSNHVAGIHLPQMLYFWPFLVFFSWPVILPQLTALADLWKRAPRLWVVALFLGTMTTTVRYNTVIHPFLLADNRHYTFYVFKLLRSRPELWYASVPVYALCAWLSVQALANTSGAKSNTKNDDGKSPKSDVSPSGAESDSNHLSFVLVWVASTALSLITAPLVEPRYFLIPWLIWRLHVPGAASQTSTPKKRNSISTSRLETFFQFFAKRSSLIELTWYMAINYVTCRLFLEKGFRWQQEPENIQRFMW